MRFNAVSTLLLVLAVLNSCHESKGSRRLQIAGSSTLAPLLEEVIDAYAQTGFRDSVSVDSIGSGMGIRRFIAGECHVASASRPMSPAEIADAHHAGIEPVGVMVAMDAVALCTGGGVVDGITMDELSRLLVADSWKDVHPEWPDEDVMKYYPGTDSGTFDFMVETAFAGDAKPILSSKNLQLSEDDHVLVHGVQGDPWALGFFGYSYFVAKRDGLSLLPLDGKRPSDGASYPLSRPLFLYFNGKAPPAEVNNFIHFTLDFIESGRLPEGFLPPPDDNTAGKFPRPVES